MFIDTFNDLLSEKNLNRKQFAEKSNIPYTTVIGWTNLHRLPDYSALIKIAKFFNVSADYLLGLEDDFGQPITVSSDDTYTTEERQLIKKYRDLNPACKKLINNTIDTLYATSVIPDEQKKRG